MTPSVEVSIQPHRLVLTLAGKPMTINYWESNNTGKRKFFRASIELISQLVLALEL